MVWWWNGWSKQMTWDQMLIWLILPVIVGGGIAYVIVWLRGDVPIAVEIAEAGAAVLQG